MLKKLLWIVFYLIWGILMNRIGESGRVSESRVSKLLKAKKTPASGALDFAKGDMVTDTHVIEAKSTVTKTMGIKHSWLGKIAKEAKHQNKRPAITLSFTTPEGKAVKDGDWVAIPLTDWADFLGNYNE